MITHKSHVQLIKSILKNFSYIDYHNGLPQGKKVKYLDLKTNRIKDEHIENLGTIQNYFSTYMEQWLSQEIESPFCDFVKKVLKSFRGKRILETPLTITSDDAKHIINFFNINIARSSYVADILNSEPLTAALFSKNQNHEMGILFSNKPKSNMFSDYFPNIFINESKANLVVSRLGTYFVKDTIW